MSQSLIDGLIAYLLLVPSLAFHEYAHAQAATWLGDDTAKREGRLTLNPLAHIDPIGTVAIPLFMLLANPGFAIFGWAKPVPFDPRNLEYPRRDDFLITIAGPLSNLLLALIGCLLLHLVPEVGRMADLLRGFIGLNILLAVFNLTPIPPLDGYRMIAALFRLPESVIYRGGLIWPIVLLILLNFGPYRELIRIATNFTYYFFALITGNV